MEKVKVDFTFDGKSIEVEKGMLLAKILEQAGYAQDLVCGGNGKCGKCLTEIIVDGKEQSVLSCQTEVETDIIVTEVHNMVNRKINVLTSTQFETKINPILQKLPVRVESILADHCTSFAEKITEKYKLSEFGYDALKSLSKNASNYKPDKMLNMVIFKNEVIDIRADDKGDIYGLAIDIGSTTVAAFLYDMTTMEHIHTYSALNEQTALGADVISRIGYCIKEENGTQIMQEKIADTINRLIEQAKTDGIDPDRIYHVVLCGNSTMQHLFLGLYPAALGKAPFASTTRDFVEINGSESLLNINKNAKITFLPLLGGFVGADTTAVLIGIEDDDKPRLIIDLGTNGEIAVGTDEKYLVASTACGPALEGAGLSCGMRAADGAIQYFTIDEDKNIVLDIIGGGKPIGICGSGIIDILAELLRCGVLNQRGKMLSHEEYIAKYGEDKLSARIHKLIDQNVFMLASAEESGTGDEVYFAQRDSRYVQLAKAAIATGCEILVQNYGMPKEQLHEICLSGAFGNYLDVTKAQFIGLIPKYEGVPVRSIGNGAGTGVQMYLLDQGIIKKCKKVQKNSEHTELNFEESFKDTYFDEMTFKNGVM